MRELDGNLERLIRAAELPAPDVDAACRDFLARLAPPRRSPWIAPLAAALLLFGLVLGVVLLSGGDATPAGQEEALDALIAKLGHETVEARDQASRAIGARGLDLEYALPALERLRGSGRVARELRDMVGAELSHDDLPPIEESLLEEIRKEPSVRRGAVLEVYDVADLTANGRVAG